MFKTAGGSNKGHVYSFDSQFAAIIVERQGGTTSSLMPFASSVVAHDYYIERGKKMMEYMYGFMQHAQDNFNGFMHGFVRRCVAGFRLHTISPDRNRDIRPLTFHWSSLIL